MPKRPNILFIMSDQHAPDALGALNHPAVISPHLDALAARGVTFTRAHCAYPMCTPSRASFMTGLLAPEHGVWELGTPLSTDLPTWPHVLRHAGYRTSLSGRMHMVGPDQHHGFQRRVHPEVNAMPTPFCYGHWDTPVTDDHVMLGAIAGSGPTAEPTRLERYDEAAVDAAIEELTHLTTQDPDAPWALTVGLIHPHFPYTVSQPWYDLYEGIDIPEPRLPADGRTYEDHIAPMLQPNRRWLGLTTDGATPEQVCTTRRTYYAMITHLDHQVGRLIAALEATGQAENTLIVYTSDHGDNMGEHGLWSKTNFYQDSIGIPMIIVPPDCPHPGTQCAAPVSLIDWMATTCELANESLAFGPLPGRSLLPLLADPDLTWPDRPVIADYASGGTRVPMRMVVQDHWKAWFAPGFAPLLFDLRVDPHEWHDLATDPAHAETLAHLASLAEADGWDGVALTATITRHKRRLAYIQHVESPPY